jgi:glycerol-3-phosphate dehydrogenase subunit B
MNRTDADRLHAAVVVIGAGVAGTAAALAAARDGADTLVVDGGTGASTLWTGAIDDVPWTRAGAAAPPLAPDLRATLDALDAYVVGDRPARLLSTAGLARPARGRDSAILDAFGGAGGAIAVARCRRPGWSADALAASWGECFVAIDAELVRHTEEELVPDADFASRHDDDARLGWLAERLREALARSTSALSAVVLPPSLGVSRPRAAALSARVGVPCGEAIGLPGGPAGLRFESARDRALRASGIRRVTGRAERIEEGAGAAGALRVHLEGGGLVDARAVVLASGGLVGGGLEYTPAEATLATALPAAARLPLRSTIDAAVVLGVGGRALELPGTLFGSAPESIAAPFVHDGLLDRAGILAGPAGAAAATDGGEAEGRGLYAAGEVVADAVRTWLGALAGGGRAGAAAARHALRALDEAPGRSPDEATASPP